VTPCGCAKGIRTNWSPAYLDPSTVPPRPPRDPDGAQWERWELLRPGDDVGAAACEKWLTVPTGVWLDSIEYTAGDGQLRWRARRKAAATSQPPKPEGYYKFEGEWWEADRYGQVGEAHVIAGEKATGMLESPVRLYSGDGFEVTDRRWLMRPVTPPTPCAGWHVTGWGVPTRENCDGWCYLACNTVYYYFWENGHRQADPEPRWLLRRDAEKPLPAISDHDMLLARVRRDLDKLTYNEYGALARRFVREQEGAANA